MKSKNNILQGQTKVVKHSFTGNNITRYSGLNTVSRFMNKQGIIHILHTHFPTRRANATKFGVNQILLAIIMSSFSGISRLCHIASFSGDGLVRILLNLKTAINEDAISRSLKKLGEKGSRVLQEILLSMNSRWLKASGLESITLDADSTVKSVFGNQEGAAKGYNPHKKNAKSYHPLLVFVSEMKLLYHTWFRPGSTHTSNGIVDFLHEVKFSLPKQIKKVFFRADSGFFAGNLLDQLEAWNWDYLIKVKLKNLDDLFKHRTWLPVAGTKEVSICEITYKAKDWKRSRTFKVIRTVSQYVELNLWGKRQIVPEYEFACYVSSYECDAYQLHELYKQRSTSETWIEQVKNQTMAGGTLTDNFWANDILWQLSTLAYNMSVIIRKGKRKFYRQEHRTFAGWFVLVPAKITKSGHQIELKIYENHFYRDDWEELNLLVEAS